MDFVGKDAPGQNCPKGVACNLSLGGGQSTMVNAAAANLPRKGIFVAVAAGNDGADASAYSPASEPSVCTIGATDIDDSLATYSNIGRGVDMLAPGTKIKSTWMRGGTNTISGTSMASPHVAGLAAYFLGMGRQASGLCQFLASRSIKDTVSGVPSSTPNLPINNRQTGNNGTVFRRF